MGIFKRLRDITLASINDLIDKAEDPAKLADQYIRDMGDDIADAEKAVAKQIAIEIDFKKRLDEAEQMVEKRTQDALKALEKNDEDLARRLLNDKKVHQETVDTLMPQYEQAKQMAETLKAQLTDMKDQFAQLKAKRDMLVARSEAAKAQKEINKAMNSFSADSAVAGFDRLEKKVNQAEAEAHAGIELRGSTKSLDDEVRALDRNHEVEDELAALRAQVAQKNSK